MIARIPEKLQSKEPYTPVTAGYSIRLDANESPYNVSAELREDMKRALDDIDFNRYPDPLAADLCKAFARAYGIRSSYVTAGNGSDELIGLILSSFLEKGEGVTVALPDFSMYAFYASLSEEKLHVFKRDGAPTLDGLRAFVRETGSAAVIFSNPCNPTGQGYDRKSVLQFVLSTDALCIIDEAYMDFWDQSILADAPWLENAFVLRTLSKVFGAAALRLGRCVGFELETIAFYLSTLSLAVTASSAPGSLPKQLLAIVLGMGLFLALGLFLRDLERVKKRRWLMAAGAIGLLGITLVLGKAKFGATNWVTLGGISFQPSEIAKICYIFAGSATLERLFRRRNLALFIVLTGVCIGLLGLMSDFGTAAIFFVTFLVIAYLRSGDAATLALICGGAAFGAGIIVQFKPYILSRFAAWGHAWEAASGSGYQQTRTMSAAASGGLFGMGAGNGWLERIPAGDTDLVFGMLCEEWGLVIALLAVACILTLAWFAVRASRTGRSSFYTIAACAAGSLLVFQTSLNVFGSVDLLPLTGVTFPFVSNGGSAMLSAWGLLAYLKAMDTRADASFAIGRAAERKLDEEAARMAAPAEDAFEKEDGHAED